MKKCKCCELENSILEYISKHPRSSIAEISVGIDTSYISCWRALEGRQGSLSQIGLVANNYVRVVPAINTTTGRLCWKYTLI